MMTFGKNYLQTKLLNWSLLQIYAFYKDIYILSHIYIWENKTKHLRLLKRENPMEDKQENSWGINLKIIFLGLQPAIKYNEKGPPDKLVQMGEKNQGIYAAP